jgi:hypothetical protein
MQVGIFEFFIVPLIKGEQIVGFWWNAVYSIAELI